MLGLSSFIPLHVGPSERKALNNHFFFFLSFLFGAESTPIKKLIENEINEVDVKNPTSPYPINKRTKSIRRKLNGKKSNNINYRLNLAQIKRI